MFVLCSVFLYCYYYMLYFVLFNIVLFNIVLYMLMFLSVQVGVFWVVI